MAQSSSSYFDPQPTQDRSNSFYLSEVRVGLLSHNVTNGFIPWHPDMWITPFDDLADIKGEALFHLPTNAFWSAIGSPQLNVGGTLSLQGYESILHAGLTWTLPVMDTGFFGEVTLGGAIHNGHLSDAPDGMRNLGCRVNFYEGFGLGYQFNPQSSVILFYEHTSNADLCSHNAGLSNLGIKYAHKF